VETFLKLLVKEAYKGNIIADANVGEILKEILRKIWKVKNVCTIIDPKVLENYLARYVNRITISKLRFEYLEEQENVH